MLMVYGDSLSLFDQVCSPLRVTFREVDILTLGDASLAAYAQVSRTTSPAIPGGGRFQQRTDRRQRAVSNARRAALIKLRLFTVILP